MDLNAIIFPAPDYYVQTVEAHEGEIIFIPKNIINENCKTSATGTGSLKNNTSANFTNQSINSINEIKKDEKSTHNSNSSSSSVPTSADFIPCLLLLSRPYKKICKNFLIFFHGNAEDIFLARDVADRIRSNLSMNILIVEYPGYSIYKEDKNSDKVLLDCLTVFDFLTETLKVEEENIYVFGRSIGTSPALYLSSKRKPASLILMSPFTSVRAVAQNLVGNLFKFLVSERYIN
jgi:hypothetical protein